MAIPTTASSSRPASRLSTRTADIELATIVQSALEGPKPVAINTPTNTTPALSATSSSVTLTDADGAAVGEQVTKFRSVAICVAAFFVIFTTCGCLSSFGVYQEMYQTMSMEEGTPFTGASPAQIDLIGTLAAAFQTIFAPVATAWTKRFSPRRVIFLGATLFFTASMLASYSVHIWQFLLTQGFLLGLATCFSYLPAATIAPTWYIKHRGVAMGIILSGTGIGGLVWAPVIHILNEKFGFRIALRIAGSVTAAAISVGGLVLDWDPVTKKRLAAEKQRLKTRPHSRIRALWEIPLVDWRIARSPKFVLQLMSSLLQASAYFTPLFFFSAYARTLQYSPKEGANFIAINNVSNAIGKIVVGMLADKLGRINMLLATTAASAVVSYAFWLPSTVVHSLVAGKGLFVTYAILNGALTGPYVSLFPTCIVELFGPHHFASINGVLYMSRGVGTLLGTPTAGALLRGSHSTDPGAYFHMSVMVAVLLTAASAATLWIRVEAKKS